MGLQDIVATLSIIFIVSRILNYGRYMRQVANIPGIRCLCSPVSPIGALLPTFKSEPGRNWQWEWRSRAYKNLGSETISVVPYLFGRPAIYTCSLEVARQVVSTKSRFFKARDTSEITLIWGPNIFAANGDEWKRHRRTITPAFTNGTYKSVWNQTSRVFDEMMASEGWADNSTVEIPIINTLTNKLALILISTCGFGNPIGWQFTKDPSEAMSFGDALTIVSHRMLPRIILPRWVYNLPIKSIRDIELAYGSLKSFMQNLINARRQELSSAANASDVLSLMIRSSEEDSMFSMDESELLGNTFLLLFAGHDTTARTLDACLGLLGLYESVQEELYEEIMEVMPAESDFTFENSSRLTKVRASFLEAARLFPAGFMMIRDVEEDLVLHNTGSNGDDTLSLQRGTRVVVDMVGLHYNPRLFPDPEEFKPGRWYNTHENDLTMFSFGSRACIGRKFAITEGVTFLAKLLRHWRIEIVTKDGETKEQWRARVMKGRIFMTLGVGNVSLRLVKRSDL